MIRREEDFVESGWGGIMDTWGWVYWYYLVEVSITAATTCKDSKKSYDIRG